MSEKSTRVIRPFPTDSLEEAVRVAQAIQDNNNGRPIKRILLADAIQRKPGSSDYRVLLSSAAKYGLTSGNEKSDVIALTPLGESLTRPRTPTERMSSLKKAALQPELFGRVFQHFNNGKLPQGTFFENVLERDFGVPRERCRECAQLVVKNGRHAGLLQDVQGAPYVILDSIDSGAHSDDEDDGEVEQQGSDRGKPVDRLEPPRDDLRVPSQRFIFIAHGKNRTPLVQLQKILNQFKIPFKIAVDEPQMFRPISAKVAETMKACHSAIFIFTADEEYRSSDGERAVWRPGENVVYELGAASVLYENRVVILKEEGIDFPTDFKDIGYISFPKDRLEDKGTQLIAELIGLGLMRVEPA